MTEVAHEAFIGFTYNGIHSSTLGLKCISGGNRFNTNLLPTLKDVTTDIAGVDGMVYYGSTYTKRVISVSFAFDGLTDEQTMLMKTKWLDQGIHDLVFDEHPERIYSAKITGNATIKHLPFDKDEDHQSTNIHGAQAINLSNDNPDMHYKGEGSLQFTCFYPYARGLQPNWDYTDSSIAFNNNGDLPAPVKWWFELPPEAEPHAPNTGWNLTLEYNSFVYLTLSHLFRSTIESPTKAGADHYIVIDMNERIIEGYDYDPRVAVEERCPWRPTGRLYNQYVQGSFFLLPKGNSIITCTSEPYNLEFNYLYL